ncbi:unnamed protein product [Cladocopium goreaui]|uniref:Uncharacterized protein n=2 Tax=Cladocopium goreaui TaxID=2562237 RepID=A0A9P1CJP0_9DINO|nr:unnamed protein product [Cladocopium goreaui]
MAVPIADFEDESGFHTPENISVDADDAWGEEAQRLLRQHRLSCDLEAVRRDQKPQRRFKRPFETLETAFQVTCQVMVALLSPRVHPWMRRLSACLRMQRTYPEVLPSPSLSVFVSGFHVTRQTGRFPWRVSKSWVSLGLVEENHRRNMA